MCQRKPRKTWCEYSRQQQYSRKQKLANGVRAALTFCENQGFLPHTVEVENVTTGDHEVLNVTDGTFLKRKETIVPEDDKICSTLYVKDKYSISNEAFHELSVISNLPSSSQVTKKAKSLNSQTDIQCAPNAIVGVQQHTS